MTETRATNCPHCGAAVLESDGHYYEMNKTRALIPAEGLHGTLYRRRGVHKEHKCNYSRGFSHDFTQANLRRERERIGGIKK